MANQFLILNLNFTLNMVEYEIGKEEIECANVNAFDQPIERLD